jgi:DNA-binding transcriptional regulator PaaX
MAKRTSFSRLTNGLFNSAADFLLWQIGLFGGAFGQTHTARGAYKSLIEADKFLQEVNHNTLRHAWQYLKRQGLVETMKRDVFYEPVVTLVAEKRLKSLVPTYRRYRPWDKRIYLITYDIPEKRSKSRDLLREQLKTLGAAGLQQSVWICPYNLETVLDDFVRENKIEGTIILSDTGTNGGIGGTSIEELVIEVYDLETLNEKYREFLEMAKGKEKPKTLLAILYLSILKDDPQLPFKLLPYWWLGDEAYKIYKKLTKK